MILNYYYKDSKKSLRHLRVTGDGTVESGFKVVMEHLRDTKEVYLKPILCVIQGGKQ